jgi:hypothetical protein
MKTKTCSKCKKVKDINHFWRNKRNPDGLNYWCKDCFKAYCRAYYKTNKGKQLINLYQRNYRKSEKGKLRYKRYLESESYKRSQAKRKLSPKYLKKRGQSFIALEIKKYLPIFLDNLQTERSPWYLEDNKPVDLWKII